MIMSKFLPERKKLLEDVYEKASSETTEKSFSGILKNLEIVLRDEYKITLSYKTFENYYKAIVKEEGDYPTKPLVLDDLSRYLGFDSFRDYCSGWKSFEYKINQAISKLAITIINKPLLQMPEFITKKSSIGIVGIVAMMLFFTGNAFLSNKKGEVSNNIGLGIFGEAKPEKKCMYWDKFEYKLADCEDDRPYLDLQPVNFKLLKYFKKIKRKDTLTVDNALGKTWYSKYNGNVEFFTMDGVDPDTGKELDQSSSHMILKYAGVQDE
ncbi:hypothetical protein AR686_01890 [Chryseobacterium aquaticum subsp. greenlandense]|uniref:Uncharacterized protein n=2 Tax=Chryseobacterium aquaticum TaxID=452084 RepID=A0A101CJU2_9FLAO|nr:hypothetical protein AR686_01890 [Chryseobacterium aquaticum subsp. greenlandense]